MVNEHVLKRKGKVLTLRDGRDYTVLPLPLDDLIEVLPIINKLEESEEKLDVSLVEDIKKLLVVALKQNANVNIDNVGQLVDISDLKEIVPVLVGGLTNVDAAQ